MELLEESKHWKEEAKELLKYSKLLEILKTLGDVYISGSYKYDLMLGPDIDFLLVCNGMETSAQKLLNKLVRQRYWNGYKFYDMEHFRSPNHPSYPKAYYVGTKTTFKEHRWKTDIWVVNKYPSDIDDSWISNNATNNIKLKILEFKKIRNDKNLGISSYDIYDAVINKKVSSFEDLQKLFQ